MNLADFNGDGKADLLVTTDYLRLPMYHGVELRIWYGSGNGTFSSSFVAYQVEVPDSVFRYYWYGKETTLDANGDGLADIAYMTTSSTLKVQLSTGTGMTIAATTTIASAYPSFADINDDGMDDLVANGYFYKSNGNGTFASPVSCGGPSSSIKAPLMADIDGDGRPDYLRQDSSSISYSYANVVDANGDDAGDRLESVTNPLGGQTSMIYGNSSGLANNKIPFIVHPVTLVEVDDGYNELSQTTYDYSNAYYKYADRDFRGFGYVKETNPDLSTVETTYEQNDDYKKGRPLLAVTKNPGGTLLKRLTYTWASDTMSGTTAKFVKLTGKRTDIYGTTNVYTNEAYTYDNTHGSVLTTVSSGSGGAENVTTTDTYINKGTWVWRKASETVAGSSTGTARQTTYTYDSTKGNLLTKTYVNNAGSSPVETYTYDSYGNQATYKDPKNNITYYYYAPTDPTYTHVTRIVYPPTGSVTHSVSMDYNLFGKLDQQTDENNNTTYYDYDAYGRLTQINYPPGAGRSFVIQYLLHLIHTAVGEDICAE